jgi:predicted NAD-dependent protein-ADP-ribosyltransferase YbiA (DUF1768 family)
VADNSNAVIVRFGTQTPFFPLSMTYGMLMDPSSRTWFVSIDHYVGYHMLARDEHRRQIMNSPNGWLAQQNLQRILRESQSFDGDPVIHLDWESNRDAIMLRGLKLKFGQNLALIDLLTRTRDRNILDESRLEDLYWCNSRDTGQNMHGRLLMEVRACINSGAMLNYSGE